MTDMKKIHPSLSGDVECVKRLLVKHFDGLCRERKGSTRKTLVRSHGVEEAYAYAWIFT